MTPGVNHVKLFTDKGILKEIKRKRLFEAGLKLGKQLVLISLWMSTKKLVQD
jgi:hypothetical protein